MYLGTEDLFIEIISPLSASCSSDARIDGCWQNGLLILCIPFNQKTLFAIISHFPRISKFEVKCFTPKYVKLIIIWYWKSPMALNGLIDQKWIEQWFGPPYMTGCSGLEAVTFVDFQWLGASGHLWAFDIFDYFWTDIYMRKRWSNWLAPAGFLHLSLIIPQGVPCHNVAFFSPGGSLASFLDIPKCALFLLSNAGPNWS